MSSQAFSCADGLRFFVEGSTGTTLWLDPLNESLIEVSVSFEGLDKQALELPPRRMLSESFVRGNSGATARDARRTTTRPKESGRRRNFAAPARGTCLALALVGENLVCANDLAVQRTRDQRLVFDLAVVGVRDRDPIDFQSSTHSALVVCLGFDEIRQGT